MANPNKLTDKLIYPKISIASKTGLTLKNKLIFTKLSTSKILVGNLNSFLYLKNQQSTKTYASVFLESLILTNGLSTISITNSLQLILISSALQNASLGFTYPSVSGFTKSALTIGQYTIGQFY